MPQYQQPMMQAPYIPPYSFTPQPEPADGFAWAGSRKEVDDYQMKPNRIMVFFHRDQKVFWFKTTDSNGNGHVTTCDYTERDETDTSEEYATKSDIKKMFDDLKEVWNG